MEHDELMTEQQLNAFVDKELEASERDLIFDQAEKHQNIDAQLSDYRKLKELVQHAYSSVPAPQQGSASASQHSSVPAAQKNSAVAHLVSKTKAWPQNINVWASVMLLVVGCVLGAIFGNPFGPGKFEAAQLAGVDSGAERVLVHLRSKDHTSMDAALTRAEALVASRSAAHPVMVEVITNGEGVDLLRSDLSPYTKRITALAEQDVIFIACSHRLEDLREQHQQVLLVAEAEFRYTAFERVVGRLREGWGYENIKASPQIKI
ncbi:MAG: hypothetical protein KBT63_10275 [Porticoccaceae bacterium]|nr:hypothetical protein [Porticoccaceae bacterium]